MELEHQGEQIRNCFDELCHLFADLATILPLDIPTISKLTSVDVSVVEYLVAASGIELPAYTGMKKYFYEANGMVCAGVNLFTAGWVKFISMIQSAALDHFPTCETLLQMDFIMILVKLGFIVYDCPVGRILLGPIRARRELIGFRETEDIILTNEVYRILSPCLDLLMIYEMEESIFTIGSVNMNDFTPTAAKKFVNDVSDSCLR
ncbi:Hypothetical protein FSTVST1_291 [Faustovirus ST1]|nr:Hypothetical protein FSTVST1_291 [Faustovirus ST1]